MSSRENEGLQTLGRKTEYKMDYAPEVLETFQNKHPENDYWVQFNCPEFTSLCPITGQPDFAEIKILYIPGERMVESKSLKLYLFSFRNHGDFHELVCSSIRPNTCKRGRKGRFSSCSSSCQLMLIFSSIRLLYYI